MTSAPKLSFSIYDFPYDRLRVGTIKEKTARISDYKDAHQFTFVEEDGVLRQYTIDFYNPMHSSSISYYIDKDGNNIMNPGLYFNPDVHHQWSKLNDQGEPTRTKEGDAIENHLAKFKAAIERECRKLSDTERGQICGPKFMKLTEHTELIADIATHPLYAKNHPTKPGLPDETKSACQAGQ